MSEGVSMSLGSDFRRVEQVFGVGFPKGGTRFWVGFPKGGRSFWVGFPKGKVSFWVGFPQGRAVWPDFYGGKESVFDLDFHGVVSGISLKRGH